MKKIENDNKGNERVQFEATLLSISGNTLTNTNGKLFRVGSIEFADVNGVVQKSSCIIYEGNYKYGMEPGKKYVATATFTTYQGKPSVIVTVSHLEPNADRPSIEMFLGATANATDTVVQEAGVLQS